jgi:hypothetical protein
MDTNKTQSRKKFLGLTVTAAALLSSVRFFIPEKKKKVTPRVKMLTQDGRLVEIDAEKVYKGTTRKISDEQLKNFVVKKNKTSI